MPARYSYSIERDLIGNTEHLTYPLHQRINRVDGFSPEAKSSMLRTFSNDALRISDAT